MKLIRRYVHSKTRAGVGDFIGPKTFTKAKRAWEIRTRIDLPAVVGSTEREVVETTMRTSVTSYKIATGIAKAKLARELVGYDDWTDFSWEVWAI